MLPIARLRQLQLEGSVLRSTGSAGTSLFSSFNVLVSITTGAHERGLGKIIMTVAGLCVVCRVGERTPKLVSRICFWWPGSEPVESTARTRNAAGFRTSEMNHNRTQQGQRLLAQPEGFARDLGGVIRVRVLCHRANGSSSSLWSLG